MPRQIFLLYGILCNFFTCILCNYARVIVSLIPRPVLDQVNALPASALHVYIHCCLMSLDPFLLRLSEKFQRKSHRYRTVSQTIPWDQFSD